MEEEQEEKSWKISAPAFEVWSRYPKVGKLSVGLKRKFVHEIAPWPKDAFRILRHFKRKELREIICAEMGRERKYTGYTKFKMIEHLLKLVSEKSSDNDGNGGILAKAESESKRQKSKEENLSNLQSQIHQVSLENVIEEKVKRVLCQNLACRATLSAEDAFCKRCSCCICHQYDDNKDPSLWLTCNSDFLNEEESCGMSCHLKCALNHERAGIADNRSLAKLDGRFYCVICGKVNEIMSTWRKQMLLAKDARRVDVMCLRLSLSHKLLQGTKQYKELLEMVEAAVKKLKNEVGSLDHVSDVMARGIVNRLTCGAKVQKLCASALESFDAMCSEPSPGHTHCKASACCIRIEHTSPTSVVIVLDYEDHLLKEFLGCRLWHRESAVKDYPEQPTYIVLRPQKRFDLTDLNPSTKYSCKISLFSSTRILGAWETSWVTSTMSKTSISALDIDKEQAKEEICLKDQADDNKYRTNFKDMNSTSCDRQTKLSSLDNISTCNNEGILLTSSMEDVRSSGYKSLPPSTPCKSCEMGSVVAGSCTEKGSGESDYDFSVRMIKWLESEGHISEDFRVKFLTWFSLKATTQQRRVVSVFVDAFVDDPSSLAGQLLDTFTDMICCEKKGGPRMCSALGYGIKQ